MVRRTSDGPARSDAGGDARPTGLVGDVEPSPALPPFAEVFVPQFEAILAVLDRLTGFALVPIEVPSRDVAWVLGRWLSLKGRRVHAVFGDMHWRMLPAAIVAAPPGEGGVALVINPREVSAETHAALRLLNQRRDTVAERLGAPLLWCGSADFLRTTADLAPDFWSVRELPLHIDVPDAFAGAVGPWNIVIANPSWLLSPTNVALRADDVHQYPGEKLFADPTPEKLRSDARFLLTTAQGGGVDRRLVDLALAILRASDDRTGLALAMEIAGSIAGEAEDLSEAEARLREAHTLFEETGNHAGVVRTATMLADILRRTERLTEAAGLLESVLRLAAQVDDWEQESRVLLGLAMVQHQAKQLDRAKESLEKARVRLERLHDEMGLAGMHAISAMVLKDSADLEGAEREIRCAAEIFERGGRKAEAGATLILGAEILHARGDAEGALVTLRRAADLADGVLLSATFRKLVELARALPDSVAPERDTFISRLEADLSFPRRAS